MAEAQHGMTTRVECNCYISPRDVVFQNWRRETEPQISLNVVSSEKLETDIAFQVRL